MSSRKTANVYWNGINQTKIIIVTNGNAGFLTNHIWRFGANMICRRRHVAVADETQVHLCGQLVRIDPWMDFDISLGSNSISIQQHQQH